MNVPAATSISYLPLRKSEQNDPTDCSLDVARSAWLSTESGQTEVCGKGSRRAA